MQVANTRGLGVLKFLAGEECVAPTVLKFNAGVKFDAGVPSNKSIRDEELRLLFPSGAQLESQCFGDFLGTNELSIASL
jgi:hypothetical protein